MDLARGCLLRSVNHRCAFGRNMANIPSLKIRNEKCKKFLVFCFQENRVRCSITCLGNWLRGLGCKLTLAILLLILVLTGGLSVMITRIMDDFLLEELVRRGTSVSLSAATPAAFSLLSDDRLALDNLAAKIVKAQEDIGYLAIVGRQGTVIAHNELQAAGSLFEEVPGVAVAGQGDNPVRRVERDGKNWFEFRTPILFADKKIGDIYLGIAASTLEVTQQQVRRCILAISSAILAIGGIAALLLSTFITAPVKRLAVSVAELKAGGIPADIKVVSGNELGRLTSAFNEMAHTITGQKASLERHTRELEDSYASMVRILAASIEARDIYTLGHSTRVAHLSVLLGRRLGQSEEELKDLALACFLHDLGKIRVPDAILLKPGPLSTEELSAIRRHPEHGADILRLSESLQRHIPTVLHHHEWYNGQGYPAGLRKDEIPLSAAILTLADTYDALTSSRPYRAGRSRAAAVEEIRSFRGVQFAPELTDLFVDALHDYDENVQPMTWNLAI